MTIAVLIGLKVLPLAIAILVVAMPRARDILALAIGLPLMIIVRGLEKVGLVKSVPLTKAQKRQVINDIWG